MDAVQGVAKKNGIPMHLDGARLFNAATALGVTAAQVASRADSVMFCLSKGLCAPVGSMLAGPKSFIDLARRKRKIMGGGMRQAGILAAAGMIALREMSLRLGEDHANATFMAKELSKIPGLTLDASTVEINMVFFRMEGVAKKPELGARIVTGLAERGILINPPSDGVFRFVTHYWIDRERAVKVVAALAQVAAGLPA
jgi:threonine aldolase